MYPHISPESMLGRGQYGRRSLFILARRQISLIRRRAVYSPRPEIPELEARGVSLLNRENSVI